MLFEVNGKSYQFNDDGYLVNLVDWDCDLAEAMANKDGCHLTDAHWEVINLLRDYYQRHQITPAVRVLIKAVGKQLGKEKGNSKYLYQLFPDGPARQACRYAGLPKPTGCV